MKPLYKALLALYLLTLLWLVLFKLSFDLSAVLNYQKRSLNLIPFAGLSRSSLRQMIENFVIFVPFGFFLSVNLKRANIWRKLSKIFIFSLTVEVIQFVLAIGVTDITDVITNTSGGLLGLVTYQLAKKYVKDEALDQFIVVISTILLVLLLLYRILVIRIRY